MACSPPDTTAARSSSGSTKTLSSSNHELHGVLNGTVSARAAANPTPRVLDRLDEIMRTLRSAKEPRLFQQVAGEYRRAINDQYAGPRLYAAIRASQNLIPRAFLLTHPGMGGELLPSTKTRPRPSAAATPAAARAACSGCAVLMAKVMVTELIRRGVFTPPEAPAVAF